MDVLQHEHPLTLIDLNPEYPRDEVVYDDEDELIMKQDFRCSCGRCGQEINFCHSSLLSQSARFSLVASAPKLDNNEQVVNPIMKKVWGNAIGNRSSFKSCGFYEKLLGVDVKIGCRLLVKVAVGTSLSRKDRQQLTNLLDCATTSKDASLNAIRLNQGTSAFSKNYSDSEYPNVLHLPFPNQTDMSKHFHGESGSSAFETNLTHPFHRHPLTLVDTPSCNNDITTTPTSSRITTSSIHDSMKMVEVPVTQPKAPTDLKTKKKRIPPSSKPKSPYRVRVILPKKQVTKTRYAKAKSSDEDTSRKKETSDEPPTTSSIFSPTPPREPTPPRDESKGKEGPLSQKDVMDKLKEMKRLANLKAEKEKSKKSLKKLLKNSATISEWLKVHSLASKSKVKLNDLLLQSLKAKFKWVLTLVKALGIPPSHKLSIFLLSVLTVDKKRNRRLGLSKRRSIPSGHHSSVNQTIEFHSEAYSKGKRNDQKNKAYYRG
nr:B-box-type zinc finger, zinc finger, PHD-type, DC1 [Tanacetum cinerariifolium]